MTRQTQDKTARECFSASNPIVKHVSLHLLVTVLLVCASQAGSYAPGTDSPATDLMKDVIANELKDRIDHSNWMYRVTKMVDQQALTEIEVETKDGPVHRLLTVNDVPLDSAERNREALRLEQLIRVPSQQLEIKKQYDADELRLEDLVRLMPKAFLFQYDGWEGSHLRLSFRSDPTFMPSTMESKPLQCMAGTILVDPQQKRLVRVSGHLVDNVNFGFGILGRLAKGGTFEIERTQVSSAHWKTRLVDVHVSGGMLLFKTIDKQQHETRSGFESVSKDLDVKQAAELRQSRPE